MRSRLSRTANAKTLADAEVSQGALAWPAAGAHRATADGIDAAQRTVRLAVVRLRLDEKNRPRRTDRSGVPHAVTWWPATAWSLCWTA